MSYVNKLLLYVATIKINKSSSISKFYFLFNWKV